MANRHLSRSIVLQTLFEWDSHTEEKRSSILPPEDILSRNISEFATESNDIAFMQKLLRGVLEKRRDIDCVIEKAAPQWPLYKIARIDRNILRIGLYELLFSDRKEVPAKVAINEAIELAKNFGSDTSSRFVNGVLGSVYKELGEPGKEEQKKNTSKIPEMAYEDIPIERKTGGVVYAKDNDTVYIALVHDVFGHWTLPKGGVKENETPEQGVIREIQKELGLSVVPKKNIGVNEYVASRPESGKVRKNVTYFLLESSFGEIHLEEKGGLDDARWFKLTDILDLNFYHDILPIITEAIGILASGKEENPSEEK
jgi:transcription antitermination protein NusB